MAIEFEKVFFETMASLERGNFQLSRATASGVHQYLVAARDAYTNGALAGSGEINDYTRLLINETRKRLNKTPYMPIKNGYILAERLMTHHCKVLAGDRQQQLRLQRVAEEIRRRTADRPRFFREITAAYVKIYQRLTILDLFDREGLPIGRGAKAARVVIRRFAAQPERRQVTQILKQLRDLTLEIDQAN